MQGTDGNNIYVHDVPRKPYRSPRDWLIADNRALFGNANAQRLTWQPAVTVLDAALLAAAQRQNDLAFTIRVSGGRQMPTPALAAAADLHVDTVRDILNGSKHVSLAALFALFAGLGLDVSVATTGKATKRPSDASETT